MRGGEGFVGVAPLLGEVGPGDGGGEETDRCWDGGGGGVEGMGGLGGEGVGDGGTPVYEGTEDLLMVSVAGLGKGSVSKAQGDQVLGQPVGARCRTHVEQKGLGGIDGTHDAWLGKSQVGRLSRLRPLIFISAGAAAVGTPAFSGALTMVAPGWRPSRWIECNRWKGSDVKAEDPSPAEGL